MEQARPRRLHIVRASEWMDAVVTVLQPESSYWPWRSESTDVRSGDSVALVLDTEPPSIPTERVEVTADEDLKSSVRKPLDFATVVEWSTVVTQAGLQTGDTDRWWFNGDDADRLEAVLDDLRFVDAPENRFGHTSIAEARTLLRFRGRCDGCEHPIDLTGPDARHALVVHTVDADTRTAGSGRWALPNDWPAIMCPECHDRMVDGGYTSFVAFKFSLHPQCPACHAHRTQATFYGMPSDHQNIEPWRNAGGCCVSPEQWLCNVCLHRW